MKTITHEGVSLGRFGVDICERCGECPLFGTCVARARVAELEDRVKQLELGEGAKGGKRELEKVANGGKRYPNSYTITREGVSRSIGEWARVCNIPVATIRGRLRAGVTDPALLLAKNIRPAAMMITSEGVSRSIGEWARVCNIPVETIRGRLRVGITDPALLLAKSLKPAAMMITSEGVSRSVGEWARVYGLGDETIRGRLRAGIIDPALLFSRKRVETRKCRSITFEGVTRSLVEWSALLGIPLVTIYRRWNVGVTDPALLLSKEKLKTPWKGRKGKLLTWDGVMLSISEWAERVGCSDSSLRYRLRRYPVEVALQPNLLPKKGLEFEGVTLSVREWAGQLGCTAQALYMRLKKYPLEVALRSPFIRQPCCKKAAHQKKVTMDGVTLTIREWSEKLGCNPETLRTRLQTCLPEVALVRRFGLVTYDGLSLTIREWAERLGCNYTSLWSRLQRHPPEVALRKPFVKRLKKKKRKKNEEVGDSVF